MNDQSNIVPLPLPDGVPAELQPYIRQDQWSLLKAKADPLEDYKKKKKNLTVWVSVDWVLFVLFFLMAWFLLWYLLIAALICLVGAIVGSVQLANLNKRKEKFEKEKSRLVPGMIFQIEKNNLLVPIQGGQSAHKPSYTGTYANSNNQASIPMMVDPITSTTTAAPLVIASTPAPTSTGTAELISVTVPKTETEKTGLSLKQKSNGEFYISNIAPTSLFINSDLQSGMTLVSVNGIQTQGLDLEILGSIIGQASPELRIVAAGEKKVPPKDIEMSV